MNPPSRIRLDTLQFSVQGFEGVKLSWDNTSGGSDETMVILTGQGYYDFREVGGLNPASSASDLTSVVGDLLVSTIGTAAANDTYDITINVRLES